MKLTKQRIKQIIKEELSVSKLKQLTERNPIIDAAADADRQNKKQRAKAAATAKAMKRHAERELGGATLVPTPHELRRLMGSKRDSKQGGLVDYAQYFDPPMTRAQAIHKAAIDNDFHALLINRGYANGHDRALIRAKRKELGRFRSSTSAQYPGAIVTQKKQRKGREELEALKNIKGQPGRVSSTAYGAREAGEERAYGTTTSARPLKSNYAKRQAETMERIEVGIAPLGLIPGLGIASTAQIAALNTGYAAASSVAKVEGLKFAIKKLGPGLVNEITGLPTDAKGVAKLAALELTGGSGFEDTLAGKAIAQLTSADTKLQAEFKKYRNLHAATVGLPASEKNKRCKGKNCKKVFKDWRRVVRGAKGGGVAAGAGFGDVVKELPIAKTMKDYATRASDAFIPRELRGAALNVATTALEEAHTMNITKQTLHQIIKEELENVLREFVNPKTINWEEIEKKYLAAVLHSGDVAGLEAAKERVRQDINTAKQPGGLEGLVAAAKEEFDIDLLEN